jgi:hypothetical protein
MKLRLLPFAVILLPILSFPASAASNVGSSHADPGAFVVIGFALLAIGVLGTRALKISRKV